MFLYRREPREVAKRLGVDVERFPGDLVPIIFNVSFRDPGGYFTSTKMQMRHGDVIFAANATQVEITKFTNFINIFASTASNVESTRQLIKGRR